MILLNVEYNNTDSTGETFTVPKGKIIFNFHSITEVHGTYFASCLRNTDFVTRGIEEIRIYQK